MKNRTIPQPSYTPGGEYTIGNDRDCYAALLNFVENLQCHMAIPDDLRNAATALVRRVKRTYYKVAAYVDGAREKTIHTVSMPAPSTPEEVYRQMRIDAARCSFSKATPSTYTDCEIVSVTPDPQ